MANRNSCLTYKGKTYAPEQIRGYGNELAGLYGGSCHAYTYNKRTKKITFECKENGETFLTTATFEELKKAIDKNPKLSAPAPMGVSEMFNKAISYKGVTYSPNTVLAYGTELASIYGGVCFNYLSDNIQQTITYFCSENGEDFSITTTYKEFAEEGGALA